jgi:RNA polymerase sigma-70 factor, ECF subfamily
MAGRQVAVDAAAAFNEHFESLYRFALSRLPGAEEDAADVVQEAFLLLASPSHGYRGESAVSTWLYSVVRHKIADRWRRAARRERMARDAGWAAAAESVGPETAALRNAQRETVRDVLASIAAEGRYALIMKYVDGLPQKEIARILGKSEKAAESVLFRARKEFERTYREVTR